MKRDIDDGPQARTREALCAEIQQGLEPAWLMFWGHTRSKDGSLTKSCFSQWWDGHAFTHKGIRYTTAEHFMMAEKARLFGDEVTLSRILMARTPAEAKKLGRLVQGFDNEAWLDARWDIVVQGNLAKFGQIQELKTFLMQTGSRVLVEASPFDRIWGIGMAASTEGAEDPGRWKGLNLLGFALMEVRERLNTDDNPI